MKRGSTAAMASIAVLLSACGGASIPDTADPAVAEAAVSATAPERPLQVIFSWRALEREARFNGSGAARLEPPYHARLDLFGPTGDGYLSAALVGHDLRLPPGVSPGRLPPPAMMWAVLGVVAPPDPAVLRGTREEPGLTQVYYGVGDGLLRYDLRGGRLAAAEWEGGGVRMDVRLEGAAEHGLPRRAVFRDWSGYTELELNLERVDEVEPYPPDIWSPGR
ncbi:MAG TPA: hypothetical protein VMM12_11770 [Longimicrobiales bacterium]|nr:hypothetical protein [Longimicrobiales bacterium]